MNDYYVYGYYVPGEPEPFYIGKGRRNRATWHLRICRKLRSKSHFHARLAKLLDSGILPEIDYLQVDLTEQEAFDCECQLIAYYGRIDNKTGCLCNQTDGGEGMSGHIQSEEQRIKNGLNRKGNTIWLGRRHTEESKSKMGEANKGNLYLLGKEHTFDSRIKQSIAQSNRSEETKRRLHEARVRTQGRPVCAVDILTKRVVYVFDCIHSAKRKGFNRSCINAVLAGRAKSTGGYFWRDATEEDLKNHEAK